MATEESGQGRQGQGRTDPAGRVGPQDLRVSDADRQQVVDLLRTHTGAGRLQLDEFEERSGQAFAARTRRELDVLLLDLPATGPWGDGVRPRSQAPGRPASPAPLPAWPAPDAAGRPHPARSGCGGHRSGRRGGWHAPGPFRLVGVLVLSIWAVTALGAHSLEGFWPIWVIGPWALSILAGRGHRHGHRRAVPTADL